MTNVLFSNLNIIISTIFLALMIYFSLLIILKLSGKRTFSNLNGLDLLVPVTFGPISATTILSKDISFLNGLVALLTLIFIQYILSKLDFKFKLIRKTFISEPTLLFYKGEFLIENMRNTRVSKDDIEQQVRLKAGTFLENTSAVLLESNGQFSVITKVNNENVEKLEKYI